MQPVHTPEPKVANGGGGAGDGGGGGGGEGGGEKMTLVMASLSLLIPFRLTWISPLLTVSFWSSGERGCWKMPAVEVEPLLRRYCSEPKPSASCAHARSSSRPRRPQGGATPEDGAGMAGRGAGQIAGAERGQLRSLFAEAAAAPCSVCASPMQRTASVGERQFSRCLGKPKVSRYFRGGGHILEHCHLLLLRSLAVSGPRRIVLALSASLDTPHARPCRNTEPDTCVSEPPSAPRPLSALPRRRPCSADHAQSARAPCLAGASRPSG